VVDKILLQMLNHFHGYKDVHPQDFSLLAWMFYTKTFCPLLGHKDEEDNGKNDQEEAWMGSVWIFAVIFSIHPPSPSVCLCRHLQFLVQGFQGTS